MCVCRCDADPAALAKYVVALLRKEKPKSALRELCIDQLEVFLAKGKSHSLHTYVGPPTSNIFSPHTLPHSPHTETGAFVEKLFRCLEGDSYMKGEDTPPPHTPPTSVNSVSASSAKPIGTSVASPLTTQAKSDSSDKRQTEDFRHREV